MERAENTRGNKDLGSEYSDFHQRSVFSSLILRQGSVFFLFPLKKNQGWSTEKKTTYTHRLKLKVLVTHVRIKNHMTMKHKPLRKLPIVLKTTTHSENY